MSLILSETTFRGAGRITLRQPIEDIDGSVLTSLTAQTWTLVSEQDLGLSSWTGLGDRARQGYYWASIDGEGRVIRLVPAENVVGFVAELEESRQP